VIYLDMLDFFMSNCGCYVLVRDSRSKMPATNLTCLLSKMTYIDIE